MSSALFPNPRLEVAFRLVVVAADRDPPNDIGSGRERRLDHSDHWQLWAIDGLVAILLP